MKKIENQRNVHIFVVFIKCEREGKVNEMEPQILENAFFQLKKELGDTIEWNERPRIEDQLLEYDARFALGGKPLYVATKAEIGPRQVDHFLVMKRRIGDWMLVANYITPKAMEMLKAKGINYVDGKGNMYLRKGTVILFVTGIPNQPPQPPVRTRLVGKAGLQVLFWLLQNPSSINDGYRTLADRANVALGNLPILFKALEAEGFLVKLDAKRWRLIQIDRLLDIWLQEFGRRLKPALFLDRFQPAQTAFRQHWKDIELQNGAIWGGEPGADLLTGYLVPTAFTLYSNAPRVEIVKNYRWTPQAAGNIAVYRKFWKDDPLLDQKAKPLLAYADLMESGDERGLKLAQMIYNQYLKPNE